MSVCCGVGDSTPQRPLKRAYEQRPAEVKRWLEETQNPRDRYRSVRDPIAIWRLDSVLLERRCIFRPLALPAEVLTYPAEWILRWAREMNETKLICLRHAEAEPFTWGSSLGNGDRDAPPDPPLSPKGQEQAKTVAQRLQGKKPQKVFVSEALRSRQTGSILASHLGMQIEVIPALSEISMGSGDREPRIPGLAADVIRQWIVLGNLSVRLMDGETGHEVTLRMKSALCEIEARYRGGLVIVVGHVASLTVGVSALCQNGPALWGKPLLHATPFPLSFSSEGWQVVWPDPSQQMLDEGQ